MAYEMDEMNKRKQERQQRQEARLRQQKKLRLQILIAVIVLLVCGGVILAVSLSRGSATANSTQPQTGTAQTVETTQAATQEPAQQEQKATTVVHFAAAGDLNITDRVVAAGGYSYDYSNTFLDVLPLLSAADLTALNFEGNLCGAPYGQDSAPQQMLDALKAAGVDILQVANSRSISKGVAGLNSTVQSIRSAGLDCVGAVAEGEEPGGYVIRYAQGVKIAVVAFTKGMDGMALPADSEGQVNLLYTDYASTYKSVDTKGVTRLLREVAGEDPDITIALLHWGSEYSDIHSDSQAAIQKLMFREGVDAIIGTHPHYVQQISYDEANGTLVAYSLGDFFGDADRAGTAYSVILDLEITRDNATGDTRISGYSYTPIYTLVDPDGNLRVVRLREAIADYEAGHIDRTTEADYQNMLYGLERLEARIHPAEEE